MLNFLCCDYKLWFLKGGKSLLTFDLQDVFTNFKLLTENLLLSTFCKVI